MTDFSHFRQKEHPANWKGHPAHTSNIDIDLPEQAFYEEQVIVNKHGRRYRRVLTRKQQKLAAYLLKGYSKRQAMLKAGYANSTAVHQAARATLTGGVASYFETMQGKLMKAGIDDDFIVAKFKKWLDAQKKRPEITGRDEKGRPEYSYVDEDDIPTQLQAYDRYKDIVTPKESKDERKKREITLTEWINDGAPPKQP